MDEPRGSRWDGGSLECWIDMSPVDCGRMKGGSSGLVVGWARGSRWDGGSLECGIGVSPVDCGRIKGESRGLVVG